MRILAHHDWQEPRMLSFAAFFNHAETPDNQNVQVPEADEKKVQAEDREKKEKTDVTAEELEQLVNQQVDAEVKKAEEASQKLQKQMEATNERNRAIETDVTAAKDVTMIGLLTPDGQPIQNETLPIDAGRVTTLQDEAGAKVVENTAQEKTEEELIEPESVERQQGRNAA